ncbi:lytic transglycosylase domain-containing protein [Komagataeibacter sp. FXV3]|uniref:lytic transglycosylase domain-containing protein n=1 Tax=Komagataeibacter sp. FXV3 TaxID=2608998 RepID=UPI00187B4CA5|nr:lytic transglycosylase domain-containing protein [Komagataeibacter sp. FXV3]MBE7730661.1 lytic transglycosylase domain-containing protein [Komagataeibacter sp. FXV3]
MQQGQTALLHPLSPSDATRIRTAFADQSAGNFDQADALLKQVKDGSLTGTVLAERCLHTSYTCTTPMLRDWLAHYPDLPATPMMQALLQSRSDLPADVSAGSPLKVPASGNRASGGGINAADAQNLYIQGQDQVVLNKALTTPAIKETSGKVAFYAGLSAWRLEQIQQAQLLFAWAANADTASRDLRSAAAWWASRATGRIGNTKDALRWLVQSARCKDCFYGVLARRAINKNGPQMADAGVPTVVDVNAVSARPAGHRALALLQVGRADLAETELRTDWVNAENTNARRSIGLIVHTVGDAAETSGRMETSKLVPGHTIDLPQRFTPRGGFVVDPALIYGIISIESRFQPTVVSRSGARGLMQLMPRTAANFVGGRNEDLSNPSVNLLIGQRYLMALAHDGHINNHLIRLLASYAVGHTAVAHWNASEHGTNESLAFLEAIPNPKIRNWIETVLLHSWMYSEKLNRRPVSLDLLAEDKKARLPLEAETSLQ